MVAHPHCTMSINCKNHPSLANKMPELIALSRDAMIVLRLYEFNDAVVADVLTSIGQLSWMRVADLVLLA